MIDYLSGTVHHKDLKRLVILTQGGVGYGVFGSLDLMGKAQVGGSIQACITTIVREQEITLYGFSSDKEKGLFEKLLSVSGIGPKTALQIISQSVELFLDAVAKGDVDFVSRTPGLGKKTAQKVILELKGKLDLSEDIPFQSRAYEEALEALKNLGYDHSEVKEHLKKSPENASAEEMVKSFLTKK